MREIKFRVWDKRTKEMCHGGWFFINKDGLMFSIEESQDFLIMQWTGLEDKNGKEVYEGDILREQDIVKFGFRQEGDPRKDVVVKYYEKEGAYLFKLIHEEYTACLLEDIHFYNMKIIGNVHKNPELLEEKKNV